MPAQARAGEAGSIVIEVTALPHGVRGAVSISGPRRVRRLTRTTTLRGVPAGAYRVAAKPVSTAKDTFYPTIASCPDLVRCRPLLGGRAKLRRGGRLTVYVVYENMVPKMTKVLTAASAHRIVGGLHANGMLVFRGARPLPFAVGSVIVAEPSAALPYGLLRKISGLSNRGNEIVLSTTAATLTEAVPRAAFDVTAQPAGRGSVAHAASAPTLNYSIDIPDTGWTCGGGSGGHVSATTDVQSVPLLYSGSWGTGSSPTFAIGGNFVHTATATLSWDQDWSCSWSREFPRSPSPGLTVAGFEVPGTPVFATLELVAEFGIGGGFTGTGSLTWTGRSSLTAHVSYDHGFGSPIFDALSSITPTPSDSIEGGKGDVSLGLKLYIDFYDQRLLACALLRNCDAAGPTPFVEATAAPTLTVQKSADPWWRVDTEFELGVGIDFPALGLHGSLELPPKTIPATAAPAMPLNVSVTPGDRQLTVNWTAPPLDPSPAEPCGCLPVTGYTVYRDGTPAATTTSGQTSVTLGNLINGSSYRITVASNAAGGPLTSLLPSSLLSSQPTAGVTATPYPTPPAVGGTAVSAGWEDTCAIVAGGTVYCSGANELGQLGIGTSAGPESCGPAPAPPTTPCSRTPVQVSGITNATGLSAGSSENCAVLATGSVDCWGATPDGSSTWPTAVPGITTATAVADDTESACALLSGGQVDCWGRNGWGELGDGTNYAAENNPSMCAVVPVPVGYPCGSETPVAVSGITNAVAVTGQQEHACAVLASGGVECWGDNQLGELGDGTNTGPEMCGGDPCSTTPVAVSGISNATAVSAGEYHTCAVLADGRVACWGDNELGQLGDGTTSPTGGCGPGYPECSTTPVPVSGITTAVGIAAQRDGACALLRDGTVECWGLNGYGSLGDGTLTGPQTCLYPNNPNDYPCSTTPVPVIGLSGVTAITGGDQHACALLSDGGTECWGWDVYGQLGDGGNYASTVPSEFGIP